MPNKWRTAFIGACVVALVALVAAGSLYRDKSGNEHRLSSEIAALKKENDELRAAFEQVQAASATNIKQLETLKGRLATLAKESDSLVSVVKDFQSDQVVWEDLFPKLEETSQAVTRETEAAKKEIEHSTPVQLASIPAPAPAAPTKPKEDQTTVYVTNTGAKYHSAGCQYLRRSSIPMTKAGAIAAGYGPCSRCSP